MAILAVVLVSVQCEKMDKVNAAETVTAASIGQKMEPMTAIAMDVEIAEEGLEAAAEDVAEDDSGDDTPAPAAKGKAKAAAAIIIIILFIFKITN